jgi:hypothetical protein
VKIAKLAAEALRIQRLRRRVSNDSSHLAAACRLLHSITDMRVIPLLLLAVVACGGADPGALPPDAGALPPDADLAQGEVARGLVAINELSARGDWLELAVRGTAPVDISGWFLSDAPDRLDHFYVFPAGTVLAPGAHVVIAADDGVSGAPFKLGREDGVVLMDPDGVTIDVVLYLAPEHDDQVLARVPDHEGRFLPRAPSPGSANP